jgi:Zn-dependent protease
MFGGISITYIIVLVVSILISLAIHEACHAYAGLLLGDDTAAEEGRISLNPLRHIDPFMTVILPIITILIFQTPILAAKPVPFNASRVKFDEYGAAMIAAAGPVSNFVLAGLAALAIHFAALPPFANAILGVFLTLNVSLFVFNLIPIPPLDGSRVLYAFAPDPVRELFDRLEQFGLIIIFAIILLGGFNGVLVHVIRAVTRFLLQV